VRNRRLRVAYRPARARYRTRAAASVLRPVLLLTALGGGLAWGGGQAREAWQRAAWNRIRAVEVAPASLQDGTPPEGFQRAVGLSAGQPTFGFSARDTAKRLQTQFPELARVRVRRTLNGGVKVVYHRRRAAAKVWSDGQWLGMDPDGGLFPLRVFAPEDAPPENVLPEERSRPLPIFANVPAGPAAAPSLAFVELLRRLPQPWARGFYKMKLTSGGQALLFLKEGPLVHWGDVTADEARVLAKAERLERVLRDPRTAGGVETARFVDDRRIAVKPKQGDPHG
jgi:hypothetical protein